MKELFLGIFTDLQLSLPPAFLSRSPSGRGPLGLLVLGEQDVHRSQEDVGNVAPNLILQDPEVGHHGINLRLVQGNDLKVTRITYSKVIG